MKVVQINATCESGSTGKICAAVSKLLAENRIENYILYTQGKSDDPHRIKFANEKYKKIQALKARILGNYGFNSRLATRSLIKSLERIQPDIVHLHNIHGHDCDLSMLFDYFKRREIKLFWTFHDCWAFTGYCPHFDMVGCEKWRTGCHNCPQAKQFSWFFDRSRMLYEKKKKLFTGLDLEIITPSQWLANLVKQSFLREYRIHVINNGIDLNIFKPTPSDFRAKYHCEEKYVLLGVAFGWGERKGLDVFLKLAKHLDERFQIVLVGTDERIDKILPDNIISIRRTQNQTELAQIYTAADLFVNPSREENYPTVNMEAIACGTPVVTFRTGGSPEILGESCGLVVEKDEVDSLIYAVEEYSNKVDEMKLHCVEKRCSFDQSDRFAQYMYLYVPEENGD